MRDHALDVLFPPSFFFFFLVNLKKNYLKFKMLNVLNGQNVFNETNKTAFLLVAEKIVKVIKIFNKQILDASYLLNVMNGMRSESHNLKTM